MHSLHPPAAGGSYQDGSIVRYCDASILPRGGPEPGVEDLVAIQSNMGTDVIDRTCIISESISTFLSTNSLELAHGHSI